VNPHPKNAVLPVNKEPKTYFIKTFGCQMNVADTEKMSFLLTETGLTQSESAEAADVVIFNGCSVRDKAVHKAVSSLGRVRHTRSESLPPYNASKQIMGMGGCVGQLEGERLFKQAPYLDFVFGPDAIENLPELIHRVKLGEPKVLATDFDSLKSYSTKTELNNVGVSVFVNIMKGCDKFCTYCIVPFTRGREKSRTIDEVLDDVADLVSKGAKEVTLLGQNVNSFGKGNKNLKDRLPLELHNVIGKVGPRDHDENFPQLLRALDQDERLKELKRVKFTSSHPLDFSDELIECYASPEKGGVGLLAPHLHLPVQSGSNRILQAMGRHHKIEDYLDQMKKLRQLNPEVGISTDLIVGFPGETEEDFEATLKLLDLMQYEHVYAFAYSPRPGTKAMKLVDDVSASNKNRRLNTLLTHQTKITEKLYQARIGKTYDVLVEKSARHQNLVKKGGKVGVVWTGRTGCQAVVNFATESVRPLTGQFVKVKITDVTALSLHGELVIL